ncbi:hypothetical protein [uncultured Luteimonas sp.]|uniref:hypothetical protein n=1 Tax=uncultured Luteimonas sp. TaxID=453144 RepID=UPI00260EDCD2|nr:hypothetical protein [uncultured Luteimonas sp.]
MQAAAGRGVEQVLPVGDTSASHGAAANGQGRGARKSRINGRTPAKGDCMKLYLPLLEILVAFLLIYLVPEGLFRVLERRMRSQPSRLRKFVMENVRGFLFGSAVALSFLFAFGVSYEDFAADSVRGAADAARRMVGIDALTICKRRAKEEFRYTPESFMEAASRFSLLESRTLDRRGVLLARGNILLVSPWPINSPEEFYEAALTEFCRQELRR